MNKNAIQRYAVWARTEMIAQVSQRAYQYEITPEGYGDIDAVSISGRLLSDSELKQRQGVIRQIQAKGYTQAMEEVAYTWFNRFIALRFMEVNNYLPTHIRVFTDSSGAFKPEILTQALHLDLPNLDMDKVAHLIEENQTEDLYRYLLLTQCNALNSALPRMFESLGGYTELLLPNNILRQDGVIGRMISDIPEEDWTDQVQIIGWLYQYYNAELKDETFALLKKNVKVTKERIPSATQLFTPDWIVRYMVENSLGRLWIEGHSDDELRAGWKYYLDEAEQDPDVQAKLEVIREEYQTLRPQDIKVIDPCMGSGHILVYAFDVLVQIYKRVGYSERDAAQSILENNLYGLDIDDRAAQLAYFAVMMKARQYDRRIFTRNIQPHVYSFAESNSVHISAKWRLSAEKDIAQQLIAEFKDAKEYGSIINISLTLSEIGALRRRIVEIGESISGANIVDKLESAEIVDGLTPLLDVAELLLQKYSVVVTNPPYMGASNMGENLSSYCRKYYESAKSDLSTVFMEKALAMCDKFGFISMINIPVWMFLSSFEQLRNSIIRCNTICNMLHFGRGVFGSDFGTTSFVIMKQHVENYNGLFRKLFDVQGAVDHISKKEQWFFEGKGKYIAKQGDFLNIPGSPIAYSMGNTLLRAFEQNTLVSSIADVKQGLATGDNNRFLRFWYEVETGNICFNAESAEMADESHKKWFPYNTGGAFRKWYGNIEYVVNWGHNGLEIKNIRDERGKLRSRPQNLQYFFKESLTWSKVTIGGFSMRYVPKGSIFDVAGCSVFPHRNIFTLLGNLNSCVQKHVLSIFSQSVNYEVGHIASLPILMREEQNLQVEQLVKKCMVIFSKNVDWMLD